MRGVCLVLFFLILLPGTLVAAEGLIFVSILPQQYFVERIGGGELQVEVLVKPGYSPHTYEPLPGQMVKLSTASIYFSLGVSFEKPWLERIKAVNPHLQVVNIKSGIELRWIEAHHHDNHHDRTGDDPHIWLGPPQVRILAENIYQALAAREPTQESFYRKNLDQFLSDLERVTAEIWELLAPLTHRRFIIYHPALGYFADYFDLEQVPVELSGREPTAKEVATLIELALAEAIDLILVPAQFSTRTATAIAAAVNGRVASVDPLAYDYFDNLLVIARILAGGE